MKNWRAILLALAVLCLTPSCSTIEKSLNRHGYVKAELLAPPVCSSGAFIDERKYELVAPADDSEYEFKRFVIDMATKYPTLKLSYSELRECFESVHGKQKNSP